MKLYHIVAMSENRVIGRDNMIPWLIKEDLRRFQQITLGHPIIMGRRTAESIGGVLPRRKNIILSRDPSYSPPDPSMIVVRDLAAALVQAQGAHEVYIIGGATLYAQTFGLVDELRVTLVHEEIPDGDTYYPEIGDGWYPTYIEPYETHSYIDYARIPPQRSVTFHGFKVI